MAFKFIVLSALLVVSARALHLYQGLGGQGLSQGGLSGLSGLSDGGHEEEHYSHPQYKFAYKVEDHHTGDIKSQEEKRDGDRVTGYYSLIEPDGHKRIVHYTADKHLGFVATVHREPTNIKIDLHQGSLGGLGQGSLGGLGHGSLGGLGQSSLGGLGQGSLGGLGQGSIGGLGSYY